MKKFIIPVVLFCSFNVFSQEILPYKNPKLSPEERAKDLLQRMTPEEKFWQLFMIPGDLGNDPAKYKNGIFGFQVSAVQQQRGAAAQLLNYNIMENAIGIGRKDQCHSKIFC